MRVEGYVALGDSFTAGNGMRGVERWPDRLASSIAAGTRGLSYFNLARDGADSEQVLSQVDVALDLKPDLVTLTCGANDVLLSVRPDVESFGGRLELMLDRIRAARPSAAILVWTYPEVWQFVGFGPRTRRRVEAGLSEVNETIREVAGERSIPVAEVPGHPGLDDPENFEADGLHPSALGHVKAAEAAAHLLSDHYGIRSEFAWI